MLTLFPLDRTLFDPNYKPIQVPNEPYARRIHIDIYIRQDQKPYDKEEAEKTMSYILHTLQKNGYPEPFTCIKNGRGLTWIYQYNRDVTGRDLEKHKKAIPAWIIRAQKLFDPAKILVESNEESFPRFNSADPETGLVANIYSWSKKEYAPKQLYRMLGLFIK